MFKKIPVNNISKAGKGLVYGVGVNDADYMVLTKVDGVTSKCPAYSLWVSMLKRGYSKAFKIKMPSYNGVSVCSEWHRFSNFSDWYDTHYIDGYSLDKDIKVKGSRIYSPETCMFVPVAVNNILVDSKGRRGKYPKGVSAEGVKFRSRVHRLGKLINLGVYKTQEMAHTAYLHGKNESIMATASAYPEFSYHLKKYIHKFDSE